jgi:Lamin Tail Domain/Calx-beta domain/Chitobiase/beta-hexosaminidase C-terminal domain/CotH kinase protein/Divergent InlB B-repeat domain
MKIRPYTREKLVYTLAVWPRRALVTLSCLFCALFLAFAPISAPAQVVINEIMYHPQDGWQTNAAGAWGFVTNETEYIEIFNSGSNTVDLSTYRLDNGITYSFPGTNIAAGAFLVVCQNTNAFSLAYPTVSNRVGNYSGSLKDSGERVTLSRLVSAAWSTVDTIQYIGGSLGGGASDGYGESIELVHPGFADQSDQFSGAWADSTNAGTVVNGIRYAGTPGRTNSIYNANALPVIGDVLHAPLLPPAGSSVLITCKAEARALQGLDRVNLLWRWDADPQTNSFAVLRMYDDGFNGDAVAGDGIYSRMFPPYGYPATTNGQLLEFRIAAIDQWGGCVTNPVVSMAEVATNTWSYLCCFGEDTGFTGEYKTYHLLMTASNRVPLWLQTSGGQTSDTYPLLDCTFVTSDGEIFYNCGIRQRCSTRQYPFSYALELPQGRTHDGFKRFDLNYENQFNNFLGYNITERAGNPASHVMLMRLWMNGTYLTPGNPPSDTGGQYMYLRTERPQDVDKRLYPGDYGNEYKADGDGYRVGDLAYWPTIAEYQQTGSAGHGYKCSTNNPPMAWVDLQNLTRALNLPATGLVAQVTNCVHSIHDWARLFAANTALNNAEPGILAPSGISGDELRIYGDQTGRFTWLPWDYSDVLLFGQSAATTPWGYSGGAQGTVQHFLFNPPFVYFYAGDVLDVLNNVMSTSNMNALIDQMGTGVTNTNPGVNWRTTYLANVATIRSQLLPHYKTNLTVTVSNAVDQGSFMAVVTNNSVVLSGQLPQNYTASLLVNGIPAAWKAWDTANMENTYGLWSTTNMTISLPSAVNTLVIETRDSYGNPLILTNLTVIVRTNSIAKSGAISGATTWNKSNGIVYVTSDVSIPNSGDSLTILPGTTVLFDAGRRINVGSGGALYVAGLTNDPVYMFPSNGVSAWSIEASGGTVGITNAQAFGGRIAASNSAILTLTDSTFSSNTNAAGIVAASGSGLVTIRRCIVSDFAKTAINAPFLVEDSLFRNMSDCGLEFGGATGTVSRTSVTNSSGLGVEGIRFLTGGSGVVTNCLVGGMSSSGIRVAGGAGNASVCYSLLSSCGTGLVVQSSTTVTNFNNTITLCGTGLSGTQSATWNTIIWSNTAATNAGPTAMSYSDVDLPLYGIYSGNSNMNRNPWFKDLQEGDCRLQSISPCLTSGSNSTYMGAMFPAGCNPMWPSNLTLSTFTVPTNGVHLAWTDNSSDEKVFKIERSTDGASWTVITNVVANSSSYDNVSVLPNELYYYRVRASHDRGDSLPSEERSITTVYQTMSTYLTNYLRMTEIMYNPTNSQDYEFLELKNIGGIPLDLTGLSFSDGVTYSFPATNIAAGGFYVLVKTAASFTNRYPTTSYQGGYGGSLNNGGERIRIKDAAGATIVDVTYNNPWYPTTDGLGYSLVPVATNPTTGDPNQSAYWRASTAKYGSPGADDPASAYGIVINEVLSHSHFDPDNYEDWIELFNAGTSNVNIGGWFISNSETNLTKFRIPVGMIITTGTYRVFTQTNDFGLNVLGSTNGFAFSEAGDSAYLSSADVNSNLTSYRVSETFGAAERNVSFGRYTRSDGHVDFTSMSNLTPWAANAYPKVGPVVISEIMYNPSAGGKEFIELHNITTNQVPLYDAEFGHPTNTWQMTGGMSYVFPTNTTIASNEYMLVVGVDPAEFRQATGLTNPLIRIFGPAAGQLNNAGDKVNISKPVDPEGYPSVPYVRVDRVEFGDQLPWPMLADNGGASLERIDCSKYGNDPTNWLAASLGGTPGAANNTNGLPTVAFTVPHGEGYESNAIVNVAVSLYPANASTVTVAYAVVGGTASQGMDYALSPGSLTFWPYDTAKYVPLRISNDALQEVDETVSIALTNVTASARLGGNALFTWTIIDTNAITLAAPTIAPAGTNYFSNSVSVTMTSAVPGSTIYYTTDGSIPSSQNNIYTGALTLATSTRLTARIYLGSYMASGPATALFVEQAPPWETDPRIGEIRVSQSADDAQEAKNVSYADPFLCLGRTNTSGVLWTGVRFTGVRVDSNVKVTDAYIQFYVYAEAITNTTVQIVAESTNNATQFGPGTAKLSARPRTASCVAWTTTVDQAWSPTGFAGVFQRTPCLTNMINEVISKPGWASSNAIVFLFSNAVAGQKLAYSYDGNTNYAPMLYYWTEPQSYWLGVLTNGPGTIAGGNVWVAPNSNVDVIATANAHYQFGSWTGDVDGVNTSSTNITVTMTNGRTLWGNFIDILWTNGTPEAWLDHYYPGTNSYSNAAMSDTDLDGHKAWQEYIAGTDPTNALSVLKISGLRYDLSGNIISWPGVTGRLYSVFKSTNMLFGWPGSPFTNNLSTAPTNGTVSCTDSVTSTQSFYQIKVQ